MPRKTTEQLPHADTLTGAELMHVVQNGNSRYANLSEAVSPAVASILADVTDYSNTLGLLSPAAKEIVAAADVVTVSIYDTTKDSDGGKWRKRCRHTSWYNETLGTATRGSRRGFPQKVLIVARASSLTIYDLDTAGCPMWMVFNAGGSSPNWNFLVTGAISSVAAANGFVHVGRLSFLSFDFIGDRAKYIAGETHDWNGVGISFRNAGLNWGVSGTTGIIVSSNVNAVAATVLPGTPIDPVRGLPNPTIAVGTTSGVSVIHWDGRVCNSLEATSFIKVSFGEGYLVATTGNTYYGAKLFTIDEIYSGGFGGSNSRIYNSNQGDTVYPKTRGNSFSTEHQTAGNCIFVADDVGLSIFEMQSIIRSGNTHLAASVVDINATYNSGVQTGNIKAALAESTADLTSLVEAEAVTNSAMTAADGSAYVIDGTSATYDATDDEIDINNATGSTRNSVQQAVNVTKGTYTFTVNVNKHTSGSVTVSYAAGTAAIESGGPAQSISAVGSKTRYITFSSDGTFSPLLQSPNGSVLSINLFSLKRCATDRSIAGNHPIVKGTITRAAVATGAELAAYGGFSASNYLEMPNSGAFQFGTGDFHVSAWLNLSTLSASRIIFRKTDGTTGFQISTKSSGTGLFFVAGTLAGTAVQTADGSISASRWFKADIIRKSGVASIYLDGQLSISGANAGDVNGSIATAPVLIGAPGSGGGTVLPGSLALPRISATAPTPAQIRAAYEAERLLFQPNAKCLLPGDNVSALAYDDSTELLHVATTAGSARLRGLAVVDKDATVYTGIDAKAGIVATRDSGSADVVLPSIPLREAAVAGIGHNGGPSLYDRRTVRANGVTTNATPTVIARFPMDKGEFGEWVIRTVAKEYDAGTELAAYEDVLLARRPGEGNVAISGSVTQRVIQEVTSSMAVSIAANTTTQCIEVTATGVASKNIEWTVEGRLA